MGTGTIDTKVQELYKEVDGLAQPGASLKAIKPDLDRIEAGIGQGFFKAYDGKPVKDSDLEEAFTKVSKSYVSALYDLLGKKQPLVDGPEWYGNLIRDWAGKVSDQHLGQIRAAIKQGNRTEVLRLINQAYEAQADNSKTTSHVSKVQGQPIDIQMGHYAKVANILAGGSNGDVTKVATNYPASIQALRQTAAIRDAYVIK